MALVELGATNNQRIEIPVQGRRLPCSDDGVLLFNASSSSTNDRSSLLSMVPISLTVENVDSTKNTTTVKQGLLRNTSTTSSLKISCQSYMSTHSGKTSPEKTERRLSFSRHLVAHSESSNGLTRSRSHHSFRSIIAKNIALTKTNANEHSSADATHVLRKSDSKSSIASTPSCLQSLLVQPLLNADVQSERKVSVTPPLSSPTPSICITYTKDEINSHKQRPAQLNRIIEKLIETMRRKHTENLREVSKLWNALKHLLLVQSHEPNNVQFFFGYFYKMVYANATLESLLKGNDEINAAFQVLSSTLMILRSSRTPINIEDLFNREERGMSEQLQYQFDLLHSSYIDEHRFLTACIDSYQTRATDDEECDFNTDRWMRILQNDYPALIEKISTDYGTKIPSVEQTLMKMLMNTKTSAIKLHLTSF